MTKVSGQMKTVRAYSGAAVYLPIEDGWIAGEYPKELQLTAKNKHNNSFNSVILEAGIEHYIDIRQICNCISFPNKMTFVSSGITKKFVLKE